MTKKLPLSRPATSAIAAFLALSTPAAFAQTAPDQAEPAPMSPTIEMSPPVMVPPVAPTTTPTVPAPTTTAPAPETAPMTTPVLRVPLDIEPVPEPAPAPEVAAKSAPKTVRAERSAPAPRQAAPEPASESVADRGAAAPESAEATLTEAAPAPADVPTLPDTEVAAAPRAEATNDALPWELAGGAAALLIAGGAAFAFTRRRRTVTNTEPAVVYEAPATPQPSAPVTRTDTPAATPPLRSTPAFAAAPHGSMGRHEAMAMAGPSEDNPFLTLKKRLKRARFYDRRERMEYEALLAGQKDMTRKPASAWNVAPNPAPAPAEQEILRPEPARGNRGLRPGFAKG